MYFKACSTTVQLLGDDIQYFSADEPLLVECELTGVTSSIEFRFNSIRVVDCDPVFGCTRDDTDFNVTKRVSNNITHYILHTVNNFDETLCGVVKCTDTSNSNSDTVNVSYKGFNNNTYDVDEQDESLMISTMCLFPAKPEYMNISYYYYEKDSSLRLPLATDTSFIEPVNITTPCTNVTCNSDKAGSFSYSLKFDNRTGQFIHAYVEVHIVHSLFKNKPLIWRTSKTYPVKVDSGGKSGGLSDGAKAGIGVASAVGAALIITGAAVVGRKMLNRTKGVQRRIKQSRLAEAATFEKSENTNNDDQRYDMPGGNIRDITTRDNDQGQETDAIARNDVEFGRLDAIDMTAFLDHAKRTATVTAKSTVLCVELDYDIIKHLKKPFDTIFNTPIKLQTKNRPHRGINVNHL
ncbi:hypothetical protein MAR_021683 [Mya arenaria]|uniref:CUB domain-containing protein n=1 Tax=Mya arenaria TaxID=6604 RepID=A0ABY7EAW8_MYAAR|nr:hypothetical protein MAR_021683 [Mya arenaria]